MKAAEFGVATKLAALGPGDLLRIVLVMDSQLERMRKMLKGVSIAPLHDHYDRIVTTRNKVQAAWKASVPKPPRKKSKARK